MPSAVVNKFGQPTKLSRGVAVNLGTLVAANTAVAFTISTPTFEHQGVLILQTTGTVGTTAVLEGSLDGGATFFIIPAVAGASAFSVTGQLTGDTAATSAFSYVVSGLGGGCLFKFGYTGVGVPAATVWAMVG